MHFNVHQPSKRNNLLNEITANLSLKIIENEDPRGNGFNAKTITYLPNQLDCILHIYITLQFVFHDEWLSREGRRVGQDLTKTKQAFQ